MSDVCLTAIAAGTVVYAAGFARRWTWLILSTTAGLLAHDKMGWCLAGASLLLTSYVILADYRSRLAGQAVVALAVSSVLLGGARSPERLSAAVGIVACLLILFSSYAAAPRKIRRTARRIVVAVTLAYGVAALLYALAAASTRTSVDDGFNAVQQGMESARLGDRNATIAALHRASDALHRARSETQSLFAQPALAVPGLGPNAAAVKVAVESAARISDEALTAAVLVDPELLKPRSGQIDIGAIRAAQTPLAGVVSALEEASNRLRTTRSPWLLPPVSHHLDQMETRLGTLLPGARAARDASMAGPALLGADRPARYLVLFVTPVESRGSGFPGNYAQLDVSAGHMTLKRFGRTRDLIASPGAPPRSISGPADFLARYNRFEALSDFYNVTFSPDFPTVANVYRELYPQAGGDPIDGVIRVDPTGLASLLRYTGPISLDSAPMPLTEENAARYLLRDQYFAFADANPDRIDVLDELGHATFDRLTNVALPSPQQLARDLGPMIDGQHLSMIAFEPTAARLLHQTGLSAAIPHVKGDQLGVIVNNLTGSKIDLFLKRDISYQALWNPSTGEITATATITLHNSAPSVGPERVVGNLIGMHTADGQGPPWGTNRAYLSVYSPWFPGSVEIDAMPAGAQVEDELGRKVASVVVDVPSGETRTVTVHYRGTTPIGERYHLDIWRQSLTTPGQANVEISASDGGRLSQILPLDTNRSIDFLRK